MYDRLCGIQQYRHDGGFRVQLLEEVTFNVIFFFLATYSIINFMDIFRCLMY